MILHVTRAKVIGPTHLDVEFNTGTRKQIDVSDLLRGPMFEPLKNPDYFRQAQLDSVCGTVVRPNGADFAPEALLALASQEMTPAS